MMDNNVKSRPILDTLQKMTNSQLANVDIPIEIAKYSRIKLPRSHRVGWPVGGGVSVRTLISHPTPPHIQKKTHGVSNYPSKVDLEMTEVATIGMYILYNNWFMIAKLANIPPIILGCTAYRTSIHGANINQQTFHRAPTCMGISFMNRDMFGISNSHH